MVHLTPNPEKLDLVDVGLSTSTDNNRPSSIVVMDPTSDHDAKRVDPELAKYAAEKAVVIDEATDKRLKKLIDKRVLSIMIVTYFLQALDKGTMSFAAIMGIRTDTNLVGQQVCRYPVLLSIYLSALTNNDF